MTAFKPQKETLTPIPSMSLKAMQAEYESLDGATGLTERLRERRAALCTAIKAANRQQRQACASAPAAAQAHARA